MLRALMRLEYLFVFVVDAQFRNIGKARHTQTLVVVVVDVDSRSHDKEKSLSPPFAPLT